MSKLKELKEKLNLKVALIGGAVVVSTSLGTCHFMASEPEPEVAEESESAPEEAPTEAPEEEGSEE
jgi:hypothetical protein